MYGTSIPNISHWCKELLHPSGIAVAPETGSYDLPEIYHRAGEKDIHPDTPIQEVSKALQK